MPARRDLFVGFNQGVKKDCAIVYEYCYNRGMIKSFDREKLSFDMAEVKAYLNDPKCRIPAKLVYKIWHVLNYAEASVGSLDVIDRVRALLDVPTSGELDRIEDRLLRLENR